MNTDSPSLTAHLRRAFDPDREGPKEQCPGPEEHLRFVRGELDANAAERLESHIESCAACRAERALARSFEEDGSEPGAGEDPALDSVLSALRRRAVHRDPMAVSPQPAEPAAAAARSRFGRRALWRLAAAAMVVFAVGIGLQTWNELAPPELPERVESGVTRGAALVALEPAGDLASMPSELRWAAVEDAVRYRVTLRAVDDRVLWQTEVQEARAELPAAVISLSSHVRYFWQVEGIGEDTRVVAVSESVSFAVRPDAPAGGGEDAIDLEAPP